MVETVEQTQLEGVPNQDPDHVNFTGHPQPEPDQVIRLDSNTNCGNANISTRATPILMSASTGTSYPSARVDVLAEEIDRYPLALLACTV